MPGQDGMGARATHRQRRVGNVPHGMHHSLALNTVVDGQIDPNAGNGDRAHHAVAGQVQKRHVLLVTRLRGIRVERVHDVGAAGDKTLVVVHRPLHLRGEVLGRGLVRHVFEVLGHLRLLAPVEVVAREGVGDHREAQGNDEGGDEDERHVAPPTPVGATRTGGGGMLAPPPARGSVRARRHSSPPCASPARGCGSARPRCRRPRRAARRRP